jgi:rod shape determining protein RodA
MGITPITGIPLPFLSYGGSSMVASLAAVGLAANVARTCPRATGAAPLPTARLATT